ncbi:MAG: hypothetical protein P4M01_02645 [Acidobacteriota bacterium]|nr:hypothetical protein [Acidobacteriota bacterium]
MRARWAFAFVVLALLAALTVPCPAQQPPPEAKPEAAASEAQRPPVLSTQARLMAARSIVIQHSGGSIPNDVIDQAFEGWGRFVIVYDRQKADLIVSIEAPTVDNGVSVSGGPGGRASRNLSSGAVTQVRLLVRDAHDGVTLWSGVESPKGALKSSRREDNEVEASLKVFRRFRAIFEPGTVQ